MEYCPRAFGTWAIFSQLREISLTIDLDASHCLHIISQLDVDDITREQYTRVDDCVEASCLYHRRGGSKADGGTSHLTTVKLVDSRHQRYHHHHHHHYSKCAQCLSRELLYWTVPHKPTPRWWPRHPTHCMSTNHPAAAAATITTTNHSLSNGAGKSVWNDLAF